MTKITIASSRVKAKRIALADSPRAKQRKEAANTLCALGRSNNRFYLTMQLKRSLREIQVKNFCKHYFIAVTANKVAAAAETLQTQVARTRLRQATTKIVGIRERKKHGSLTVSTINK
jgi:hypothetical protein